MDKKELNKMTKKQLLDISKSMNITGRHSLKKDELIAAIIMVYKHMEKKLQEKPAGKRAASGAKGKKQDKDKKAPPKKTAGRKPAVIPDGKRDDKEEVFDLVGASKRRKYLPDLSEGEEESAIRRAKYDTGTSEQFNDIDEDIFLPTSYLKSRIHLLVKNPYEIFVYWDLTSDDINKAKEKLNKDISEVSITLRVYDVTKVDFKGDNANSYFDIFPDIASRYFIKVPKTNCYYCVEIGLKSSEGFFVPITRSNTKKTPKDFITYGLKWKHVDLEPVKKSKEYLSRKEYIKPLISIDSIMDDLHKKGNDMIEAIDKIHDQQKGGGSEKGTEEDYFGSSSMSER